MLDPNETLCPDCGAGILRDAPRGLCVSCLTRDLFFPDDTPGDVEEVDMISTWRVLGQAGEGAFGLVYEVQQEQPVLRKAALKMLKPGLDSREIMARFAAERETLALLDHPGIARVLDAGSEAGRPWIAAEWVEGARSVTDWCAEKNLTISEKVRLFQQIVDAVSHAHQRGIIHRDLKPSNILVSQEGAPKVIDFGIARATEQVLARSTLVTMVGQVLGTPAYMSPEQASGHGAEADTRSDIYALGAVFYEMLTGQPLFPREKLESSSIQEALRVVREDAPVRPSLHLPALRGELEWILLKMLEKEPSRRYDSAGELGREMGRWLEGGTILAAPPTWRYRTLTFLRRHRTAALGALAVFLALVAGLAGTTSMYVRARAGEAVARASSARASAGEALAQRNASRGDHQTAQTFFDKGEAVPAVMHLARAVRTDPTNTAAAERLLAELVWTDFPRPAWPPLECPEFIRRTAFSPDNTRLAVSCYDLGFSPGTVWLLDPATGQRVPHELPGRVMDFAFSQDSQWIALSHEDGTVTFHQTRDGAPAPMATLRHERMIRGVSWGRQRFCTLEQNDRDSTGRLWDLSDPAQPRLLAAIDRVQALSYPAWSPDRTQVAWIQVDGMCSVWSAADGRLVSRWKTPGPGRIVFPNDRRVAVQNEPGPLQLFDAADGQPVSQPGQLNEIPWNLLASPDRSLLLTLGMEGQARLWDRHQLEPMGHFPGRWNVASFDRTGSLLALGGEFQEEIAVYDLNRMKPVRPLLPVPGKAATVSLSPDGHWLAAGGRERQLRVFDLTSRAARATMLSAYVPVWHAAWNEAGTTLTAFTADGACLQWDTSGASVHAKPGASWESALAAASRGSLARGLNPQSTLHSAFASGNVIPVRLLGPAKVGGAGLAAVAPSAEWLAVVDHATGLQLIPLKSQAAAPVAVPSRLKLPSAVTALAFAPDSTRLAFCQEDGFVKLYEIPALRELGRWQPRRGPAQALVFLPDGRLASGGEDGSIALSPGPPLAVDSAAAVRQLAVTPDGRYLISGDLGSAARIRDAATGLPLSPPLQHRSIADARSGTLLALSPDGKLLATAGCHDRAVRLWDIPHGQAHGVLLHGGFVQALGFTGAGPRLVSLSGQDGGAALHVWDPETSLPLMPPQGLPDGSAGTLLVLHPEGERVAVVSESKGLFLFDLPPRVPSAPAWLADLAEGTIGWRFGPSGLAGPAVPGAAVMAPADAPAQLAPWTHWLQRREGASPLSGQSKAEFLSAMLSLDTIGAFEAINLAQPALGAIPVLRAQRLMQRQDPGALEQANHLAWLAQRVSGGDEMVNGQVASVLSYTANSPGSWRFLEERLRQHPENPDTWNNAAVWLAWNQAWLPAFACWHRSAAGYRRQGAVVHAEEELKAAASVRDILGGQPHLLLQAQHLPPAPQEDAAALAVLDDALLDPDEKFRAACRTLNRQPRDGSAWWMLGEAAAAIARRHPGASPTYAAAAAAAYTACGAGIFWIRARLDDPDWIPDPLAFTVAAGRFPLEWPAIRQVGLACLSRVPGWERIPWLHQ